MITLYKEIPLLSDRVRENETLFLNRLWACIKENAAQPGFGAQQLAKCVKLSRVQLNRKLLNLTGFSPGKLIMHYRMQSARQLLDESEDPIKVIASKCGFSRHASFCRSFAIEFKCSPSDYRDKFRTNPKRKSFSWKVPLLDEDIMTLLQLTRQKDWLGDLLKIVIRNLSNKIFTIAQLAGAVCMSPCSLTRRIKSLFEVTPQRFIRDIRLQYASELLAGKEASVAEVAYKTGFFDPAHLSRCFKAAFGCKPSVYKHVNRLISMRWLEQKLMNQNGKQL